MHNNPILGQNGEVEKAGCVVFNERNKILLVKNSYLNEWGLPKSHAEFSESPKTLHFEKHKKKLDMKQRLCVLLATQPI